MTPLAVAPTGLTLTIQLLAMINFKKGFISAVQNVDIDPYRHNILVTSALAGLRPSRHHLSNVS